MMKKLTKTIKEINKINDDIRKIIGKPKASKKPELKESTEHVPQVHKQPSVA